MPQRALGDLDEPLVVADIAEQRHLGARGIGDQGERTITDRCQGDRRESADDRGGVPAESPGLSVCWPPSAAGMESACPPAMCMQPRAPRYRPRRVGDDVLSQVIDLHLASFIEEVEERGGCVPRYVQRAFWAYLDCGRPEGGFILLRCDSGKARVLPFSCKNRGFCPSCLGRRMSQLSANLADNVLPSGVPLRQWVLSFPYPVRLWLLWRPKLRKAVLADRWNKRHLADTAEVGILGATTCAPRGSAGGLLEEIRHCSRMPFRPSRV